MKCGQTPRVLLSSVLTQVVLALAALDATCALPANVHSTQRAQLCRPTSLRGGGADSLPHHGGPGGAPVASVGPVTARGPFAERCGSADLTGLDSQFHLSPSMSSTSMSQVCAHVGCKLPMVL